MNKVPKGSLPPLPNVIYVSGLLEQTHELTEKLRSFMTRGVRDAKQALQARDYDKVQTLLDELKDGMPEKWHRLVQQVEMVSHELAEQRNGKGYPSEMPPKQEVPIPVGGRKKMLGWKVGLPKPKPVE
ncbi:unnamed protein product [Vitrella brassicaformis CCMP3155]|uniref:Uncharacterized protein n=1 Tax=Vitrella brassicaformis (strain CCMP3155) TaxID=1169540 RepID=A0A0G4FZF6_VITBC|nr:unnamed protein product [Vitrella brassicaformis CCMP3155]|mmetsp:Transcript_36295/g.90629  ORF Transcript_36295/g.90629 Transcript_36295/m.90629 type:complete len:128 (-) Transcript_36295:470-853(-)|eukprot:CEM20908.1 unnamed protein product [Vitrella brassicaformis CCMP3155]